MSLSVGFMRDKMHLLHVEKAFSARLSASLLFQRSSLMALHCRKAFSACLSASLLFQRSCLMALHCSSFGRDSIIAFSTIDAQFSTVGTG